MLYKCTVHTIVYRIRHNGHRIAGTDPTLRVGIRGDLLLAPSLTEGRRLQARLLGPDGQDLIQRLDYAEVCQIRGEAMHITGTELVSRVSRGKPSKFRQSWLCVWDEAVALELLGRVRVDAVPGFSPEDDDYPG